MNTSMAVPSGSFWQASRASTISINTTSFVAPCTRRPISSFHGRASSMAVLTTSRKTANRISLASGDVARVGAASTIASKPPKFSTCGVLPSPSNECSLTSTECRCAPGSAVTTGSLHWRLPDDGRRVCDHSSLSMSCPRRISEDEEVPRKQSSNPTATREDPPVQLPGQRVNRS